MTSFVESCTKTVSGSAAAAARQTRDRPRARQLLRALTDKKNILITTHEHPDPDAMASCLALETLLRKFLAAAQVSVMFKGRIGGGLNEAFAKLSELDAAPWDEGALGNYDAIVLVDTQPAFANSAVPSSITPTGVIDHHRSRGGRRRCSFCDIRGDVGATAT